MFFARMQDFESVLSLSRRLSLWLFWPAVALVVWGELTPHPPAMLDHIWDKAEHFIAYFGLAAMATLVLGPSLRLGLAILGILLLGAILEVLQHYTGRDPSLLDVIANTLGAMAGLSLAAVAAALVERPAEE